MRERELPLCHTYIHTYEYNANKIIRIYFNVAYVEKYFLRLSYFMKISRDSKIMIDQQKMYFNGFRFACAEKSKIHSAI
uniref:Uncharacterized protein n=1 Tax=Trichogramma kaykai TaxID=54128 RepID=A0ABD2WJZ4_9HYME